MNTFPVAHSIFTDRASKRRIEFRRIKKQYQKFADVNPDPAIDQKNTKETGKFTIKHYSDQSPESEMPPFLVDPDFYFTKANMVHVPEDIIENVSESEQTTVQSPEEVQAKLQMQTKRQLEYLIVSNHITLTCV